MPIAEAPQTNKMHAVPQNIMDVEFKLIGDLTLRQFMYLFVFGGAAYVSTVVLVGLFKWPTVIFFAVLGVGLAFVPIQERGLDEWIVNFVRSVYSPTQRIWRREPTIPSAFMQENLAVVKQELITLAPTSSRRKLEEYLEYQITETNVDPLDIPEKQYMLKVRDAYADFTPPAPSPSVGVGVYDTPTFDEPLFPTPLPSVPDGQPQEPIPAEFEAPSETSNQPDSSNAQPTEVSSNTSTNAPALQPVSPQVVPVSPGDISKSDIQPVRPSPRPQQQIKQRNRHQRHSPNFALSPMTPDRHSGRRFINLVPASGELVLPIRGERVLKTSEQEEFEDDIKDKAQKLQQLLAQIKRENGDTPQNVIPASPSPAQIQQNIVDTEAQNVAEKLRGEQERLKQEITKLESEKTQESPTSNTTEKDDTIRRLKEQQQRTQTEYEALQRQILDLQSQLKLQSTTPSQAFTPSAPTQQAPATGKPNTLQGSIKTKTGATLEGVLVIVKSQRGEAVRAVKTDSLGHFKLSTPLANGIYTVQVTGDNLGSTFDIISVEAKGAPIAPIEIVGK